MSIEEKRDFSDRRKREETTIDMTSHSVYRVLKSDRNEGGNSFSLLPLDFPLNGVLFDWIESGAIGTREGRKECP